MNIKKSINVAVAQRSLSKRYVAEAMGVTPTRISAIANQKNLSVENLTKLAGVFNLTVSEFIALGETK